MRYLWAWGNCYTYFSHLEPQLGDIQCMRSANHAAGYFEFCANGTGKAMLFLRTWIKFIQCNVKPYMKSVYVKEYTICGLIISQSRKSGYVIWRKLRSFGLLGTRQSNAGFRKRQSRPYILTSWGTVSFSRRPLIYAIYNSRYVMVLWQIPLYHAYNPQTQVT
jgi:hypothetical protein